MQHQVEIDPRSKEDIATLAKTLHERRVMDVTVTSTSVMKKELPELINLCVALQESSEDFYASVKAVADKSGLKSSVLMKLVKAKASDRFAEKKSEVEQLAMIFEECS